MVSFEFNAHVQVLMAVFLVAFVLGAVMSKTNFCTMGAVSDWVNMGSQTRMRSWLFAMALAVLGVTALETTATINLPGNTMPPYRTENFAWLRYIVGGLIFGVGMTLASGCPTRTLLRIGGGNVKSLFVGGTIGLVAYLMFTTRLFDATIMSWIGPTVIDLRSYGFSGQAVHDLLATTTGLNASGARLLAGLAVGLGLVWYAFKSSDFRRSLDAVSGGAVVGLAVVAGWYITAGPLGVQWVEDAFMQGKPGRAAVQSFTFVSPIGEAGRYLFQPTNFELIRFGVVAVFGVVAGSLLYALFSGTFCIEWFASRTDFFSHITGGLLMGFGGFMAMGCTIGQGVTGVSTLALGSILAVSSMMIGSALTMKLQYALIK
jgi:uncharacterized membrane protein YedE/YeeE